MTKNNIDPTDIDAVDPIEEDAVVTIDDVAEEQVDTVESAPALVQTESVSNPAAPTAPASVEAPSTTVQVILAAIVQNPLRRRESTSVTELQRRLREVGFESVVADKPGILGDGTRLAVQQFQSKNKLEVTDVVNAVTLKAIFKGDDTVKVVA
jgi:peptidoglycan hydrolase-like protein with peptidoglycan-binding domain